MPTIEYTTKQNYLPHSNILQTKYATLRPVINTRGLTQITRFFNDKGVVSVTGRVGSSDRPHPHVNIQISYLANPMGTVQLLCYIG